MRPKGSAEALEMRRMIAARLLREGMGVREVARLLHVSCSSVSRWKQALERGGLQALKSKPHPGPRPRLNARQKEVLRKILIKGPRAWGYPTDLWTLSRVAGVIEARFGVKYHPGHVWYILRELGFSPQKPARRARERDEASIERWRRRQWPRIKKRLVAMGGALS